MKKLIIPVLLGFALFLVPLHASALTVCYTDGFSFFVLAGGKVNLKPFAGRFVSPPFGCHGTVTGSIVTTAPGVQTISIEGNLGSPCVNFALFGTTADPQLNFTGVFDNQENATADGNATMTRIDCGTVPVNPLNDGPVDKSKLPTKASPGYQPPQN